MKTLFWRLFPGAAATLALLLGVAYVTAQPAKTEDGGQRTEVGGRTAAPTAPTAPTQAAYVVCGECGAQLATPQAIYVASAVQRPGAPFYGMRAIGFPQAGEVVVVGTQGEFVYRGADGVTYWTDGRRVEPWRPAAPLYASPGLYATAWPSAQRIAYPHARRP